MRVRFAGRGARRHVEMARPVVRQLQPHVLVRDEVDFGTAIVAELLDIPCASVLVLAAGSFPAKSVIVEPLNELRSEVGLIADPALTMLERDLVLSPFPPSFRTTSLPPTAFSYRPTAPTPVNPPHDRGVYFSLGTFDTVHDLQARVLEGLRELRDQHCHDDRRAQRSGGIWPPAVEASKSSGTFHKKRSWPVATWWSRTPDPEP